jgi:DNA-binding NarL/FixJ family response regulator
VLVLTTYDTDSYVLPAIEAGATGCLLKDAPRDELLRAVRAAAHGQAVLSPSVATRLMSRVREPAGLYGTPRLRIKYPRIHVPSNSAPTKR